MQFAVVLDSKFARRWKMLAVEFVKPDVFRESPACGNRRALVFESAGRAAQFKKKSSLSVACVVPVNAFRQQTFPASLPPPCKRGATAFGPHASAKAVLAFARSLGWLIGTFHKNNSAEPTEEWLNYGDVPHCQRRAKLAPPEFMDTQTS